MPYLPLPLQDNPALGVRGVRVSFAWPELLRAQLRAILRVQPAGQAQIMLPMVASLGELRAARAIAADLAAELGVALPNLGVMVETPAAAVTADLLAAEADFLSIGTNDLAQYALAMDRTNAELAAQVDALHPAVLRLIRDAAAGGRQARTDRRGLRQPRLRDRRRADPDRPRRHRALGRAGRDPGAEGGDPRADHGANAATSPSGRWSARRAAEVRAWRWRWRRRGEDGSDAMSSGGISVGLSALQPLGRALMLPIAVLPVAGLLLRLGQPDLLNIAFVAAAGDAIFHNLGLLFAIGVAVGFAADGNGAAGLAGVVCFLVASNGAQALMTVPPDATAGFTGKAADLATAAFKAGAIFRAQRAARHPLRRHRRRLLQPLRRDQAAGIPRLLRRPAVRADRQRPGGPGAGAGRSALGWSSDQRRHRRPQPRHRRAPGRSGSSSTAC